MDWIVLAGPEEPFFKSNGRTDRNYEFLETFGTWLAHGSRAELGLRKFFCQNFLDSPFSAYEIYWVALAGLGSHFSSQMDETAGIAYFL